MKKLIYIFLIIFSTINTYAIDENTNSNDSVIYKNEISLDITYGFQEFIGNNYDVTRQPKGHYIPIGLNYIKVIDNKAFGIGFSYRVNMYSPETVIETGNTSMTFTKISKRRKDLGLKLSYEYRKKFKKVEFFYGISLYGFRNYHKSTTSRHFFYGETYQMYHLDQLVIDTFNFDNLTSTSYCVGVSLNTGLRFPISNHFTFITLFNLPFNYNFGDIILFNINSDRLEKFNWNYYSYAELIQAKISIAYSF